MRKLILILFVLLIFSIQYAVDSDSLINYYDNQMQNNYMNSMLSGADSRDEGCYTNYLGYPEYFKSVKSLSAYNVIQHNIVYWDSTTAEWNLNSSIVNQYENGLVKNIFCSLSESTTWYLEYIICWSGSNIDNIVKITHFPFYYGKSREEYTYDNSGRLTGFKRYIMSDYLTWDLAQTGILTYNADGKLVERKDNFIINNGYDYLTIDHYVLTYGPDGLIDYTTYDMTGEIEEREKFCYYNNRLSSSTSLHTECSNLVKHTRTEYDSLSYPYSFSKIYYWERSQWKLATTNTFQYDIDNRPIEGEAENNNLENVTFGTSKSRWFKYYNSVSTDSNTINRYGLSLNAYPNPFNPETNISFTLNQNSDVKLNVYNLKGQKVDTIANRYFPKGEHDVVWKAGKFSSGVYFIRIEIDKQNEIKKVILMK